LQPCVLIEKQPARARFPYQRESSFLHARRYVGFGVTLQHDLVDLPRHLRPPRWIFVHSMSDLFHEDVSDEFIGRVLETMVACHQQTFQVLTKPSPRLRDTASPLPWHKNVWVGVNVEDQQVFGRIHDLRQVPATLRFLSCEPLLGPMDGLELEGIAWVMVGGESGPGSRPMQAEWVESILSQCRRARRLLLQAMGRNQKKHDRSAVERSDL
jgi:protein gp37